MSFNNYTDFEKVYHIVMDSIMEELDIMKEEGIFSIDGIALFQYYDTHRDRDNRYRTENLFDILCDYITEVGEDNIVIKTFQTNENGDIYIEENNMPIMDEELIIPILIMVSFHTVVKNKKKTQAYLSNEMYASYMGMKEKDYEVVLSLAQNLLELNVSDIMY